jgi:replicative DNA helicase
MLTGIPSQDVIKQMDTVELKVRTIGKKAGNLTVKYLPGDQTTNSNAIRAYLKEYEIQKGKLPDCIAVDYLDELDTNRGNISASDMFTKDKFVTSELRQLAVDLDIVLVTASQLNRSAVDEGEHSQAMMGGGLSKVQKADNVISIYASASMKERDEFQCQFLKTRSSAGVDSKVFLGFDKNKLRLYNLDREPGEDNDSSTAVKKPTISSNDALIKSIKKGPTKKTVQEHINPETGEVTDVAHPKPAVGDESPMEKLKRLKKEGMV